MALHRLDRAGLHAAYAAGTTRPTLVTEAHLDRIARLDPSLRAFTDVDVAGARAAAVASDDRVRDRVMRSLEGVPVAIKANIAVAGLPWTAGMALYRDRIAREDAAVVTRLRQQGAIVLGSLNMHEAALGTTTDNPWFGRAFNAHGEGRTPGGSSGGSGAAVAAGMCVAALGTDTMGSVRIPAAHNGVYGLKPTNGALPEGGLEPLSLDLDVIGPIARSLDDLEAMWFALAGNAPLATAGAARRLLVLRDLGGVECAAAVLDGYHAARTRIALPAETIGLPQLSAVRTAGFVSVGKGLSAHLGEHRHSELLSADLRWLLDYADAASASPALLVEARTALRQAIGHDGVLLLPTAPAPAHPQGVRAPASQGDFTAIANVAGLPALSLPAGRDAEGMPVGVQLVGPPNGERMLLDLARTLDRDLAAYRPPSIF